MHVCNSETHVMSGTGNEFLLVYSASIHIVDRVATHIAFNMVLCVYQPYTYRFEFGCVVYMAGQECYLSLCGVFIKKSKTLELELSSQSYTESVVIRHHQKLEQY